MPYWLFFSMIFLLQGSLNAQDQQTILLPYRTHSIAISQRVGVVASLQRNLVIADLGLGGWSDSIYSPQGITSTIIDFYTQARSKDHKYTPLVQIRIHFPMSYDYNAYGLFRWGLLFGGSHMVFDERTELGRGWSGFLDGGLFFDLGSIPDIIDNYYPVGMGIELSFKANYNISKNFGLSIGFNTALSTTVNFNTEINKYYYADDENFVYSSRNGEFGLDFGAYFGLSVGMIF